MGYKVSNDKVKERYGFWIDLNKFYYSWNYLMEVVSKITKDKEFIGNEYRESIMDTVPYGNLEDTFKCVIEFIKWYNDIEKWIEQEADSAISIMKDEGLI